MRLDGSHLGYCTNIHSGETWSEIRRNLERYLPEVKRRVCADAPFGESLFGHDNPSPGRQEGGVRSDPAWMCPQRCVHCD